MDAKKAAAIMETEFMLFQIIVILLGCIVSLLAWSGTRLISRMDALIKELHQSNANIHEQLNDHHTRITVIEKTG